MMRHDLQKLRRLAVEIVVTEFGSFPCPPELSLRPETGVKLRNNQTPDRRTTKGKEWYRKFNAFREEKRREFMSNFESLPKVEWARLN